MRSLTLCLLVVACDGSDTGSGGRDMGPPPLTCDTLGIGTACGRACVTDTECGDALHCNGGGHCEAQCLLGDSRCGAAYFCAEHGFCQEIGSDADVCPSVNLTLTPVIPTVVLLIDQSGSMNDTDF